MSEKNDLQIYLDNKPGSLNAVALGCTCPQAENNWGRGRSEGGMIEDNFSADPECPIHNFDIVIKYLG